MAKYVAIVTRIAAEYVPLRRAMSRLACVASSLTRTRRDPMMEAKIPMAAMVKGREIPAIPNPAETASAMVARIEPT